ncbi:MAG TPA: helix-turn-helix domain-containing protein [Thermomicrobiales bacterium]|nr:helix-turn-helix domain-containing protein [Thermomicrobiales bacterium]
MIDDFLTVSETAQHLDVAESTVRRWIREGELPAYRIGKRRIAIRRADIASLIGPMQTDKGRRGDAYSERPEVRRLTPEEQRRGNEVMDRLEQLQKLIMEERGEKPFSPSWKLINAARDQRSRELG